MYQPISFLTDLKESFRQLRSEVDNKKDIHPSCSLLITIHQQLEYADSNLLENIHSNSELKKFFFEEYVGGISKRIVQIIGRFEDEGEAKGPNSNLEVLAEMFSQEELEWRESLTEGSQIDAIKYDIDHSLKIWAKAKIVRVLGTKVYLQVDFENDTNNAGREISRYSSDIAKYDTYSKGDDWRGLLKEGDLIDASDSTKVWYQSTIIDKDLRYFNDKQVPFLRIGYRVYDPEGNKIDLNKRPFYGWSETFDDWLPAYSPRIQQYQAQPAAQEHTTPIILDKNVDDSMDFLLLSNRKDPSKIIYATERNKCTSILLTKFLNKFGENGGFDMILKRIQHEDLENGGIGLDLVFYYLECLANSYLMYNKTFLHPYLESLEIAVKRKILNASETQLRNIKKDRIDGIVNCLISVLQQRTKNCKQREQDKNYFALEIGCVFLEQNLLEKRIDGAKYLQEICKNANLSTYTTGNETIMNNSSKQQQLQFVTQIIKHLKDKNVLNQMFSKERSHVQLVQRSEELLKLLLSQDALNNEELEMIWSQTKTDEEIMLETYKVFNEISNKLRPKDISFIIEQLQNKQYPLKEEIELIHELAKRSKSSDNSYTQLAAEYMWKIVMENNEKIEKALVNQAALSFSDIIKYWTTENKIHYIDRIILNLNSNKEGYLSIKILTRIFKDFIGSYGQRTEPETNIDDINTDIESNDEQSKEVNETKNNKKQQQQHFYSKTSFIEYISQKYDLLQVMLRNFQSYMSRSLQIVQQRLEENPALEISGFGDKCLCDRFIHSDQISERVEFLKYICQNSNAKINAEILNAFWDELVIASLIQTDSEIFYHWMREICELCSQGFQLISLPVLVHFFRSKMADSSALKFITIEGFNCVQSFFVLINESQNKMIKLNQQSFFSNIKKEDEIPDKKEADEIPDIVEATTDYTGDVAVTTLDSQGKQKMTSFNNVTGSSYQQYSFNQQKVYETSSVAADVVYGPQMANQSQNQLQQPQQNQTQYQQVDPEDLEIQSLVHPDLLEGIDGIWRVAIETNDIKVSERAAQFLIKVYTTVIYKFEDQLPEFEDCFINKCMNVILKEMEVISERQEAPKDEFVKIDKPISAFTSISSSVLQKLLPPEERKIAKSLSLIKELIKNSEKEGTHGIRPHSGLLKGQYLHTIQVSNSLRNGAKFQSKVEIGCYQNTTLWEFRKLVSMRVAQYQNQDGSWAQDAPTHPAAVRLYRFVGSLDLKDIENGKTLGELKFKPNETLTVFKKSLFSSIKVPILDETGQNLSTKAQKIFKQWFYRFSEEDPETGKRVMTPRTCVDFTRSCTEDNCDEDDNRVSGLFAVYDEDHDNKIQEDEFLKFYTNCAKEKEDVVRANLYAHSYRSDLNKMIRDGDSEFELQPRKSVFDMPRYKIANNQQHYDTIFKLLENQSELSQYAWNLIKSLTTNPNLYWRVLYLDKNPDFQWDWIFDSSSIYKMLYSLQIVEALLEENPSTINVATLEGQLQKDWTERFLALDGFQQIMVLFQKSMDLLSGKQADQLNKFEKSFLEFMLKLIKIFMMAAFQASSSNAFDVLSLVRKRSSYKEINTEDNKKQEESKDNANPEFKTPAKQVKGQFVNSSKIQPSNLVYDHQPEITEEEIFGGNDKQDKDIKQEEGKESSQMLGEVEDSEEISRFAELANIMKLSGLGEIILEKLNFEDLQTQVLELICLILAKKEISIDDKQIVENAMSLWVASLMRNADLIDKFYQFERSEEKAGKYGIKNSVEFILQGIYTYKNFRVRDEFANSLLCICQKVKTNKGRIPLFYVLEIMRNNFPKEDQYYATRECKQYFELFAKLIDEYFLIIQNQQFQDQSFDMCLLLKEVVEKLKRLETKEKKTSILEDKTLIGYINLVAKLISYLGQSDKARMIQILEECDFLHEIFYENLFFDKFHSQSAQENKCKTKESRAAGFSLLVKYIEQLEPKEVADFLEDYLWPLMKDIEKPKKWCYIPSENSRTSQFVGIVNLGCICYMNSMLQQFFMVPAFRYQLLKAVDNTPPDIVEYKGLKVDDNLLKQLQKMFSYLEFSERQAYDPTEFCFSFKDFDGNPTNTALQQDAQEFLSIFFDRIENLLKPTSQKNLLQGIFGGKVCSQLICPQCGIVRNILESFYNLSLGVKDRKGLDDSLSKMIEGGIINDFKCDNCNQKVDVLKRSLIAETPNVLIVHLQRMIFNFDTYMNDKVNTRFDFPNILNLKEHSFKEIMINENRPHEMMYDDNLKHLMDIKDEEYIYKLVGVNIHIGTAEQGHYYSLINTKRGNDEVDENKPEWQQTDKDTWKQFEDDKIKHYSFNDLKIDSFGGNNSASNMADNEINAYLTSTGGSFGKNAYMLIYEKMKKVPLIEIVEVEEQKDTAALDCADTATSRVVSQEKQMVKKEIQIDFRKVQSYVPDDLKQKVLEDNNQFLADKHIFHETFFNLIKSIFKFISDKILLTQHRYQYDYVKHFYRLKLVSLKIAKKSMFDLLSHFFHNTQMSDINNSFGSLIQFCDSHYSLQRGDDSLLLEFINDAYLKDNCIDFFNIMFTCTDKTSRFYIGKMTTQIFNKAFQIYEQAENKESPKLVELKNAAEKFLYICIQILQTQDCQKNWSRLEHFLKIIHDIGTGGSHQIHYLLTNFDIIVNLTDFMLGNRSPLAIEKGEKRPNMGAGMTNPPFDPLVSMVCNLIRYSLTFDMKKEELQWNTINKLPPETLLGYNILNQGQPEKYPLSENAYIFFTNDEFLDKILKEGYECEELGKALAHFCYKNERFSKKVSKLLLKGISKNDFEKVKNYLDVVTQVTRVKDEYQRVRLEQIFGFGNLNSQTIYNQVLLQSQAQSCATKLGIQLLSSMTDEPYSFKSSLVSDSNDDALLHLLWRYKGRIDSYTINCLLSLISLIASDESIAEYFSQIPGPTYCQARYTDWIKPYLHEQLLDARKGFSGLSSSGKEETIVKTLSLFETYEKFLKIKDKVDEKQQQQEPQKDIEVEREIELKDIPYISDDQEKQKVDIDQEENVRNLIDLANNEPKVVHIEQQNYTVIHCEPRPYIIIECLDCQKLSEKEFEGVSLVISQLSCLYTMSNATGNNNLSIPYKILRRGYDYQKVKPIQGQGGNQREQEMQAFSIGGHFESKGLKNKTDQKVGSKDQDKEIQAMQKESNDEELNKMQVSDVEEDDNEGIYFDDHEAPRKYKQNDQTQQAFQIKVVEEGQQINEITDYITQHVEQVEMQENFQKIDENQDVAEEINWPYPVNVCTDLVYKFHVYNSRASPVKCHLKFSGQQENEINLNWPRGGIKCVIYPSCYKTLILIPKIIPTEKTENDVQEIDKLNIEFFWKEKLRDLRENSRVQVYPAQGSETSNMNSLNLSNTRRKGILNNSKNEGSSYNYGIQLPLDKSNTNFSIDIPKNSVVFSSEDGLISSIIDDIDRGNSNDIGVGASDGDTKPCQICTLLNPITAMTCDLCQNVF